MTGTQRYVVNGVEYKSLDEMPPKHRALFEDLDGNGIPDIIDRALREKGELAPETTDARTWKWHVRGDATLARCRRCGYDLRGHIDGDRCPECGSDLAEALALSEPSESEGLGIFPIAVRVPTWAPRLIPIAMGALVSLAIVIVIVGVLWKLVVAMRG